MLKRNVHVLLLLFLLFNAFNSKYTTENYIKVEAFYDKNTDNLIYNGETYSPKNTLKDNNQLNNLVQIESNNIPEQKLSKSMLIIYSIIFISLAISCSVIPE